MSHRKFLDNESIEFKKCTFLKLICCKRFVGFQRRLEKNFINFFLRKHRASFKYIPTTAQYTFFATQPSVFDFCHQSIRKTVKN